MASNDNLIVPTFRLDVYADEAASKEAGRPIFKEREIVEIRFAANRQTVAAFPAHDHEPNATREAIARGEGPVTYAQLYAEQYRRFKSQQEQTVSGTPLSEAPFLTEAKRKELRALNIHTVESLSMLDGTPLKQIGPGGRDLKNQAAAYLAKATDTADVTAMASQIAEQSRQIKDLQAMLLAQNEAAAKGSGQAETDPNPEDDDSNTKLLEDCTDQELKDYIKSETGKAPAGNPSRETLLNRAKEVFASTGQGSK